jgi:hypothetical protein
MSAIRRQDAPRITRAAEGGRAAAAFVFQSAMARLNRGQRDGHNEAAELAIVNEAHREMPVFTCHQRTFFPFSNAEGPYPMPSTAEIPVLDRG